MNAESKVQEKANLDTASPSTTDFLRQNLREYGLMIALVAIILFFEFVTDGTLLQPLNITNLMLQNSYVVVMAMGMLLIIIAGHIDLSAGSVVGFIGGVAAVLMVEFHWDFLSTSLFCLAFGALIGAAQGYFVAYLKIPAFIVTLGGMLVFRGLCLTVLQGQSVGPFPPTFQHLSTGFIPDIFNGSGVHLTTIVVAVLVAALLVTLDARRYQKRSQVGIVQEPVPFFVIRNALLFVILVYLGYQFACYKGLPNVLVIMGLLIGIYAFVTKSTTIGRRIYALGGNEKATKLSGINTNRLTFLTFVNMGVLAALAGLIFAARLNSATPKGGLGFELDVIAACFIGGASTTGGIGKVTGAVIGAFIMGVLNNGMAILGIGIDWQQTIKGLVLLSAVIFDVYNKKIVR
jgi:putative multiple sugar transport system permease protein